jgi:uncharacterized membrane protein
MDGRLAPGAPTRWAHRIALACHIALTVALAVLAEFPGWLLAVPLLLPLPGLWRGKPYTHAWSSMLVVFYVGGFLAEAWADPAGATRAVALASLAAAEFIALVLYVRFAAVDRRRAAAADATARSP